MNRAKQILRDYEGIAIVAVTYRGKYADFFREHDAALFIQSTRHDRLLQPWDYVPWVLRDREEIEPGAIPGSRYHRIETQTWWDMAKLYGEGKIMSDCPLLFVGIHQLYAIDMAGPQWPDGVREIMQRDGF